jgi:DNA repair exonuclease SbcCD ATPase subunit
MKQGGQKLPDDNELNLAESTAAEQNPPEDELAQMRARVAELEDLITRKDRELAARDSRVSELELSESSLESEIVTLEQTTAESNDNLNKLNERLSQAAASYKVLVTQSNPDVPEELVTGDSIEAINNSLAAAKELVSKVRKGMEAEISLARVPAGAPERTAPDLSALSPREKIQYAIGGFSS